MLARSAAAAALARWPRRRAALVRSPQGQQRVLERRPSGLGADTAAAGATATAACSRCGFGCDQHGDRKLGATKVAVRAVRNAIEFNSIPGMVEIEGGRKNMLIHLRLGVLPDTFVDTDEVAKVGLTAACCRSR